MIHLMSSRVNRNWIDVKGVDFDCMAWLVDTSGIQKWLSGTKNFKKFYELDFEIGSFWSAQGFIKRR